MTQHMVSFNAPSPGPVVRADRTNRTDWRDWAFWCAKQNRLMCRGAAAPVEVWVEFGCPPPNGHAGHYAATVSAILDGFTNACVWADDDSEHVKTHEPCFTDAIPKDSLRISLSWETEGEL